MSEPQNPETQKEYFRRSRNGCATCRTGRLKCDEAKPSCSICTRRKVQCEGYPTRFQWVQQSNSPKRISRPSVQQNIGVEKAGLSHVRSRSLSNLCQLCLDYPERLHPSCNHVYITGPPRPERVSQRSPRTTPLIKQSAGLATPSHRLHRALSLLPNAKPIDKYLFEYNLFQMPKLIFVSSDPLSSASAQQYHLALALEPNSLLLDSILASAAIHLCLSGVVDKPLAIVKKIRALKGLQSAITNKQNAQILNRGPSTSIKSFSPSLMDDMILGTSTSLIGMELSQGAPLSQILPLIKGSKILIMERYHETPLKQLLSPMFLSCQGLVSYFDILSCVPYPRAPFLNTDIWFQNRDAESLNQDPLMGCFSEVLMLLGKVASLVSTFYINKIDEADFAAQQKQLTAQLNAWQPFNYYPNDREDLLSTSDNFVSAQAGNSHKFATMIFLYRSHQEVDNEGIDHIQHLTSCLRTAMSCVPIDSSFIATMLWPAFVLGCESREPGEQAESTRWFLDVLMKQRFENIRVALTVLQEQIWANKCPNWVRFCWQNKIQLMLA